MPIPALKARLVKTMQGAQAFAVPRRPCPDTIAQMRRLLLILLLAMLPLQSSWAALCAYCPDDCISETMDAAADAAAGDAAVPGADSDCQGCQGCQGCQFSGVGIAAASANSPLSRPANMLPPHAGTLFLQSSDPDRPERPNWARVR